MPNWVHVLGNTTVVKLLQYESAFDPVLVNVHPVKSAEVIFVLENTEFSNKLMCDNTKDPTTAWLPSSYIVVKLVHSLNTFSRNMVHVVGNATCVKLPQLLNE